MIPKIDYQEYINNGKYKVSLSNNGIDIVKDNNGKIVIKTFSYTRVNNGYIIYHPTSSLSCENCNIATEFNIIQHIKDIILTIQCKECGLIQNYV